VKVRQAKLAFLWLVLLFTLATLACGSTTADLCPRACTDVDLTFESSTATSCVCVNADGARVNLW